jgi:hypothetical protein
MRASPAPSLSAERPVRREAETAGGEAVLRLAGSALEQQQVLLHEARRHG